MPRTSAPATEAQIKRAIRAAQKCGLTIKAIVPRGDGVSVEIGAGSSVEVTDDKAVLDNWMAAHARSS